MPQDQGSDILDRLASLEGDLRRLAILRSTDNDDGARIAADAGIEIHRLRGQVDALARLAWLPPVRKQDGSIWAEGEWRAGRHKGVAISLEHAREELLWVAAAVRDEEFP